MHSARAVERRSLVRVSFDRGTLLLEGAGSERARTIPGVLFDPRVGRVRAPAHLWPAVHRGLEAAGVEIDDRISPGRAPAPDLAVPELRSYQRHAVTAWELAGRRGIVVLPTGAGKTRVAIAAMAVARCSTLVIVPTRVLLDQWRAVLQEVSPEAIGQLGDGVRDIQPITVSTFESALRHMDRLGASFEMLVADEAHHFGSGKQVEALEMSTARFRIGLTATPPEREAEAARLEEVLGPVVLRRSVVDLAGTHLASFEHLRTYLDLTPTERAEYEQLYKPFQQTYRELRAAGLAPTWAAFMRAASSTVAGRRALQGFHAARRVVALARHKMDAVADLLARHADERVLVFCASNTAVYALSRRHLVPAITTDIGRAEREDMLARFRAGSIRTIVSSRVLNEGVDVPEVAIGIVVGGVMGAREHVQRVGRLLRPRPGKTALVHELVCRNTFEVSQSYKRRRGLAR